MKRSAAANALFSCFLLSYNLTIAQSSKELVATEISKLEMGISEMNKKTSSIQATFNQEKNLAFLSEVVKSSGQFYYQKESKIRWAYELPSKYIIVIGNGRISIDNDREKKTFDGQSGKMFRQMNDMIISCVNGKISQNPDYLTKYYSDGNKYVVKLIPKSKNISSFVKEIQLYISSQDFSVEAIKMIESDEGDYTYITFVNKKFNQKLDSKLFEAF